MRRAVGYIRVSTEDQAQTGVSLPAQREKLIGYAQVYEIDLIAIEPDDGASGKSLDRPGLQAALGRLDRGEADGLLITKLDRLTRSIADWDHLIKRYFGDGRGKKLWSVSDAIDTGTAGGRLVLNVIMTVAQWEREAIAERTRDALRHKIATGSRCGKVRYGSAIDPSDPRVAKKSKRPVGLVAAPDEVEAIDLMKRLRAHGMSFRAIADELTGRSIPTRDGRERWNNTTVRKILMRSGTDG